MSNLAIIPARGGSKRIPRKNIKDFLGKPIIAYSIEAALQSGLFEEVMVSTDDEEIAEIAQKLGAIIPFMRSASNSNDFASTMEVINEVVSLYKLQLNKVFDLVCCIYPTAPLIQIQHLKKGLNLLLEKNFDSVFPVVVYSYPVWRGVEIFDNGKAQMIWPEFLNSRSQDLKKVYHDAGQWYWMNIKQLDDSIFTSNTGSILLSEEEVQDIDNSIDWKLAEMKYKLLYATQSPD
ncbi:MAG: pseudaminic acid cytidylyltransferase [Prolixibacteraceae bacterium]|jgi:N-acylneuraminate cytidylyltransferase|nr:pseudaminic acid cytidylyltransferase [Prolixibacteraceae bacterium]